ncbi:MAG: hypothetical protein QOC93_868 [Actinomycetota bacterium]|nr:hypothetical protein [Actinomycetota bacterium]
MRRGHIEALTVNRVVPQTAQYAERLYELLRQYAHAYAFL